MSQLYSLKRIFLFFHMRLWELPNPRKIKATKWSAGAGDHGHTQFSFPLSLSLEITSFEVAEIIGSKGQYTLSCIHLLLIEFWSHNRSYGPLRDLQIILIL